MTRTARIAPTTTSVKQIEAYLPTNYELILRGGELFIVGEDVAGWTLDDYVIPRLASGLIVAVEVTES